MALWASLAHTKDRTVHRPYEMMTTDMAIHRGRLLALRATFLGDMTRMEEDALTTKTISMPTDMEELGSEDADQEVTLRLLGNKKNTLDQIEAAIQRIEDGCYGQCEKCGGRISKTRLDAIPYTAECVQCASQE